MRVIDDQGNQLGIMAPFDALKIARDAISVPFALRQATSFIVAGQSISGCFYYSRSDGKTPGGQPQ